MIEDKQQRPGIWSRQSDNREDQQSRTIQNINSAFGAGASAGIAGGGRPAQSPSSGVEKPEKMGDQIRSIKKKLGLI